MKIAICGSMSFAKEMLDAKKRLGKKIFLLNSPPDVRESKSSHEILIMQPVVLEGNIEKIGN